jgi:HTH-type transcriptional regulator/antitoxin HigA
MSIADREMDTKLYSKLAGKAAPTVITSEKEYERLMKEFDRLFHKSEMTPEEDAVFNLLVVLIEKYEKEKYYESSAGPLDILKSLMEEHEKEPKDLWELLGSKGRVSDILNGKRAITKSQAAALGEYFHVSPSLFLDLNE